MKLILLIIVLLSLTQGIKVGHQTSVSYDPVTAYGSSQDFQQYNDHEVFVEIDYSDLGLTEPPFYVNTYITCHIFCVELYRYDRVFDLTEKGFKVYVEDIHPENHIDPELLADHWKVYLHWEIKYSE